MKRSIVRRLIIIGVGIAVCIGVVLFSTILINQKGISDGYVINIAGRERMLSQKISKEVFFINSQNKADFKEFDRAVKDFQDGLDTLRYGNKDNYPSPTSDQNIIAQLELINELWIRFRQSIMLFRSSTLTLNSNKIFLDEHNKQMLTLSDNVVKAMVKSGLSGQDVDDSGRQRMLTQRMAYQLMRYTNKWDAQSYQDFYSSYNLYNETILRFYIDSKYKRYPELFSEIEKTYNFWLEYSKHTSSVIANQQTVVESVDHIATQNRELLAEIEKVVAMYEKSSTGTRTYLLKFQVSAAVLLLLLAIYAFRVIQKIRGAFNEFIQKSKELANIHGNVNAAQFGEIMTMEGENELSEISRNISQFVSNMGALEHDSNRAIELSDNITTEITKITNDVIKSLETLDISDDEKQKIVSEISLSEDIAIQTSEELIATSKLLNRLKKSLDVIAKYYNITQNSDNKK